MVKLSIAKPYKEEEPPEPPPAQEVEFRLEPYRGGGIELMARVKHADLRSWWHILIIQPNGKIFLQPNLPEELGLPLDACSRVLTTKTKGD